MPGVMNVECENDGNNEDDNLKGTLATFDEITASSEKLSEALDQLLSKDKAAVNTDEGISILNVKNHLLLQYLTNLVFVILNKCSGKSIENNAAIDRLVKIRTVIERIRPLEQKLKYQIDKLVKIALTGTPSADDATQFRANPMNLMDNCEETDEDSDDESSKKEMVSNDARTKDGIYIPPRLAAVRYDGEETFSLKQKELVEKAKKRALNSSIVQKMQEEYLDAPTEIAHGSGLRNTISKEERERTEYEETYYTRLPVSKKDRILAKQRAALTSGGLHEELTRFDDFRALDEDLNKISQKKKKSFKTSGKRKKKLSFKKKKRFRK